MTAFPIDRAHPPRRIVFRDDVRHLVLRPWSLDDVDPMIDAMQGSLPELRAFMPWAHHPITREGQYEVTSRFQGEYWAGKEYVLGVFDGRSDGGGRLLGGLGLHPRAPLNPAALEVGYWIRSSEAKRGITTLAVRMAIVLAFDWLDCDRVQVSHDEANDASRRVAEKCGFVYEGMARNIVSEVTDAMRRDGYRGTRRHRLYGLTSEDVAAGGDALGWLPAIRGGMTVVDELGQERRGG
jgi:RimJ/RimL family protein N-acetyltransferase